MHHGYCAISIIPMIFTALSSDSILTCLALHTIAVMNIYMTALVLIKVPPLLTVLVIRGCLCGVIV